MNVDIAKPAPPALRGGTVTVATAPMSHEIELHLTVAVCGMIPAHLQSRGRLGRDTEINHTTRLCNRKQNTAFQRPFSTETRMGWDYGYGLQFWCASGCAVECRICNWEVAGSHHSLGYFAPRSTQPSIPLGLVNEYQLRPGRQRQVWLIPIADERVGAQVKL